MLYVYFISMFSYQKKKKNFISVFWITIALNFLVLSFTA